MSIGNLYIISAPSGAGKTSLVRSVLASVPQLAVSVSHTTRPMRPGERDGEDYFFVSHEEFQNMINGLAFLEHAQVFDNFYGTAQQTVIDQLHGGLDVILEIDWQGAAQVKSLFPDSVSIFILPPSIEVLGQRLRSRGQDDEATVRRRMRDAVAEISHYPEYDYLLVNDDFGQASLELSSVIIANRLALSAQQTRLEPLLSALLA